MTRKDYVAIALCIAEVMENAPEPVVDVLDKMIDNLSIVLKRDNPRFDADKFRAVCWCEGK